MSFSTRSSFCCAVDGIARGEAAFLAGRVADLEVARRKTVGLRVADARDAVVVPEHAVVARRHHERHADVHVVLRELDVFAVEIHLRRSGAGPSRRTLRRCPG